MTVTFLGTGAGVPSRARNVSSIAVGFDGRRDLWLFDCGEGTQHQFLRCDLKISRITRIFITHLHGDHIFGLPGLLATLSLSGDARRVDLYGPPGIDEYVWTALRLSATTLRYPLEIHIVRDGPVVDDGAFSVRCLSLDHRIATWGYRIDERERPGRLDAARAVALGVPAGPLHGRLQRGESMALPDGRMIDGRELVGPTRPGRSVAICVDTIFSLSAVELARGVDLLAHEATFATRHEELARATMHATAVMAARTAVEAGARRLLLTHISARYVGDPERELLAEARSVFPQTDLAQDLLRIDLPRRDA